MGCADKIPKKRGRPRLDKHVTYNTNSSDSGCQSNASEFKYALNGPLIAVVKDKNFYSSFIVDDTVISVGDSVDILVRIRKNGNRDTKLGKIASIFEQTTNRKQLFVEIAYFFDRNEGIVKGKGYTFTNWTGFSHENEVIASNKVCNPQILNCPIEII